MVSGRRPRPIVYFSPVSFAFSPDALELNSLESLDFADALGGPESLMAPQGAEPFLKDLLSVAGDLDAPSIGPDQARSGSDSLGIDGSRLSLRRFTDPDLSTLETPGSPASTAAQANLLGVERDSFELQTQVEKFEVYGEFVVDDWNTFSPPVNLVSPVDGAAVPRPPPGVPEGSPRPGAGSGDSRGPSLGEVEIPPELSYSTFSFGPELLQSRPCGLDQDLSEPLKLQLDQEYSNGYSLDLPATDRHGLDLRSSQTPRKDLETRIWSGVIFDFSSPGHPSSARHLDVEGATDGHPEDL